MPHQMQPVLGDPQYVVTPSSNCTPILRSSMRMAQQYAPAPAPVYYPQQYAAAPVAYYYVRVQTQAGVRYVRYVRQPQSRVTVRQPTYYRQPVYYRQPTYYAPVVRYVQPVRYTQPAYYVRPPSGSVTFVTPSALRARNSSTIPSKPTFVCWLVFYLPLSCVHGKYSCISLRFHYSPNGLPYKPVIPGNFDGAFVVGHVRSSRSRQNFFYETHSQ